MKFDLINLIGSGLLLIYAVNGEMWPFVILNGVWALYSLKDVLKDIRKK